MVVEGIKVHRFIANFLKYRYLLIELVKKNIKIKYRRSVLGIFWSLMEPLLFMIVLTIIFSTLFKSDIANYPIYLLTGRLAFTFFSDGSSQSMDSILINRGTIKKLYVPKYIFTLSVVLSSLVTYLLSLIVLFAVMIATQTPFTTFMFLAVVPTILLLIFTIGVGLILATYTVFFRDIKHLYGVFLTLLLYASAIFFPADIIPAKFQILLQINPLFVYIEMLRDAFLYATWFDPIQLIYGTIVAIVSLIIGIIVLYKNQDRFILYI
jgi:lipopolysaccharide transport system permease protein